MKVHFYFWGCLLLCMSQLAIAQIRTGQVTDENNLPLPGATVVVEGTSRGTTTDFDGNFQIEAAAGDVLLFSYVGYSDQRITVGNTDTYNVQLELGTALEEVVVTSLGITRDKKSLGYAQQTVAGDKLVQVKDTDLNTSLTGKVAGLQMIGGSSATFDSGFLRLRGETGILYVVDGIKMYSQTDINTDNIENISVLKGAAATALYGVEARNGVVVITSKRVVPGQETLSVDHTTSFTNVSILQNYQNEYGGGYDQEWDIFEYNAAIDPPEWAAFDGQRIPYYAADESWGPRLDGTMVRHWDSWIPNHPEFGQLRPWSPNPDNVRDFYDTGIVNNSSIVWGKAGTDYNIRSTIRNLKSSLVMPNANRDQVDVNVSSQMNVGESIELYSNINYQFRETNNGPQNGYGGLGANFNQWWQRQLDINRLKKSYNYEGNFYSWNMRSARNPRPLYWDAPHFSPEQNKNIQRKDVVYGNLGLNYHFNDNLKLNLEIRRRFNNYSFNDRVAFGGLDQPYYNEGTNRYVQNEVFGLLNYKRTFDFGLDLNFILGYQMQQNRNLLIFAETSGGLSIPNFYSIASSVDRPDYHAPRLTESKYQSNFTSISLGYDDLLYLDASYRLDWGSTANVDDNRLSTFGLSMSFLLHELYDFNGLLPFAKIRGGLSQAPIFPDPYQTSPTYDVGDSYGGNPSFYVPNTQANPQLLGGTRDEFEIGLELKFLDNRLGFDLNHFQREDKELPIPIPIPASSGFSRSSINSGKTSSNGFEITLNSVPIQTDRMTWDLSVNFATLEKTVDFLSEGIDTNVLDSWVSWGGLQLQERVGEEWGTFVGRKRKKDDAGNYILEADGSFVFDTNQVLGNLLPDFTGGLVSSLSFDNFYLNLGIDFQKGGLFYTTSNMFSYYSGLHQDTAGNNDRGNPLRDAPSDGGGVHRVGVDANGDPVDIYMDAAEWGGSYFGVHDEWLYDASYIKLRQMRLGYRLPESLLDSTPFKNVDVSLFGNNLLLLYSNIGHGGGLDPSEIEGSGSIAGVYRQAEGGQLPPSRTIGLNIKLNF